MNLTSAGSIKDGSHNPVQGVPKTGPAYTLDKTAPTVISINRVDPSPTNHGPLHWTVTFSEPVVNVVKTDFGLVTDSLGGTAPVISAVAPASGPSSSWTVTVTTVGTTGTFNGSIKLNLTGKGSPAIQDASGTRSRGRCRSRGRRTGTTRHSRPPRRSTASRR